MNRYKKLLLFVSWLAVSAAFFGRPLSPSVQDDIREAVFRDFIADTRGRLFFFSLHNEDPSGDFMRRFASRHYVVKPLSEAGINDYHRPAGKTTGQPGLIVDVSDIRRASWFSYRAVNVEASMQSANGVGSLCRVVWNGQRWIVEEEHETWIE